MFRTLYFICLIDVEGDILYPSDSLHSQTLLFVIHCYLEITYSYTVEHIMKILPGRKNCISSRTESAVISAKLTYM